MNSVQSQRLAEITQEVTLCSYTFGPCSTGSQTHQGSASTGRMNRSVADQYTVMSLTSLAQLPPEWSTWGAKLQFPPGDWETPKRNHGCEGLCTLLGIIIGSPRLEDISFVPCSLSSCLLQGNSCLCINCAVFLFPPGSPLMPPSGLHCIPKCILPFAKLPRNWGGSFTSVTWTVRICRSVTPTSSWT